MSTRTIRKLCSAACLGLGAFLFTSAWQGMAELDTTGRISSNFAGQVCLTSSGCFRPEWIGAGTFVIAVALILLSGGRTGGGPLKAEITSPGEATVAKLTKLPKLLLVGLPSILLFSVIGLSLVYGLKVEATVLRPNECNPEEPIRIGIRNNTFFPAKNVSVRVKVLDKISGHVEDEEVFVLEGQVNPLSYRVVCRRTGYTDSQIGGSNPISVSEPPGDMVRLDTASMIEQVDRAIAFGRSHEVAVELGKPSER